MGGSVRPGPAQLHQDSSIIGELKSVLSERGTQQVQAQLLGTLAVLRPNGDIGVQVEAVQVGLAWDCRGDPGSVGITTEAQDAATGAAAKCGAALDRCTGDAG